MFPHPLTYVRAFICCLQILEAEDTDNRQSLVDMITSFVSDFGIRVANLEYAKEKHIKAKSITKEVRQRQLQKFFKAIFSHVSLILMLCQVK